MTGVPLNIDWQQILLHLLNFAILFFVLYLVLYKPVKNFMDKRKAGYDEMDEKAKANLADSEKAKEEYETKLAEAEKSAADIKNKAHQDAAASAKEITDAAHEEASQIIAKAQKQAQDEQKRIVSETSQQIEQLAKDAAKRAIFDSTSDAYDSFLDDVEGKANDK